MSYIPSVIAAFVSTFKRVRRQGRDAEQVTLLRVLASCLENGVSPAPVVSAFGAICSDEISNEVTALATLLDDGARLGDALRGQQLLLPPEAVVAAEFNISPRNTAIGLRAAADALETRNRVGRSAWGWGEGIWVYLLFMVGAVGLILSFLGAFIVPKMIPVIGMVNVRLNPVSEVLFTNFDTIVVYFWLFIVVAFFCWTTWFIFKLAGVHLGRGLFEPALVWLYPRTITPSLLRMLQLGFAANVPVPEMLQSISRTGALPFSGARFGGVETLVEEGVDFLFALHKQGYINSSELKLLESSHRVSNLPWVLEELARNIDRRVASRWAFVFTLLNFAGILLLGLVVALLAVGLFLPLISLIEAHL